MEFQTIVSVHENRLFSVSVCSVFCLCFQHNANNYLNIVPKVDFLYIFLVIYSDPVYRFSILDFWWEHKVAVIKQYKHSTRKENVSMHLNVSSISGEASDIAGPFDQHQRHQIRVSKIVGLERDTQGLYSVYISNLDPT